MQSGAGQEPGLEVLGGGGGGGGGVHVLLHINLHPSCYMQMAQGHISQVLHVITPSSLARGVSA